ALGLGVVLGVALALTVLALALGVGLLLAALAVALLAAEAIGQPFRLVGDLLLLGAEAVLVHAVALGPGSHRLLLADDLAQSLEQFLDALLLLAQLLVAVVGQEDGQDGADVVGQFLVLAHRGVEEVRRDGLVMVEDADELVELGVHALLAGLLDGLLEDDGLLAVFRL